MALEPSVMFGIELTLLVVKLMASMMLSRITYHLFKHNDPVEHHSDSLGWASGMGFVFAAAIMLVQYLCDTGFIFAATSLWALLSTLVLPVIAFPAMLTCLYGACELNHLVDKLFTASSTDVEK